jgi:hypothetical protein
MTIDDEIEALAQIIRSHPLEHMWQRRRVDVLYKIRTRLRGDQGATGDRP